MLYFLNNGVLLNFCININDYLIIKTMWNSFLHAQPMPGRYQKL